MKTFLACVALAITVAFASQAFALPYCPNGTWQNGKFVCGPYEK